jgi:hypothetical protein
VKKPWIKKWRNEDAYILVVMVDRSENFDHERDARSVE